ncbi:MAG: hypothetical protein AAFN51_12195 [Pseudomonadota bacterium]
MLKPVVLALSLAVSMPAVAAAADQQQDFIINQLTQQYDGLKRQARGNESQLLELQSIYKDTIQKVLAMPGLDGRTVAEQGLSEMQSVVN